MLHVAAMLLMIASAITAAACCLVAGGVMPRAVPWQARQSALMMALGMVVLGAADGDARLLLLVAATAIASAMLGVVGTRGRAHADACFHRALGCVVMAVCALAMLSAQPRAAVPAEARLGHAGHGGLVPMSLVAGIGVAVLLGLMLVARIRHRAGSTGVDAAAGRLSGRLPPASERSPAAVADLRGRVALRGRILLEVEGVAMAVSLIFMAAMVLAP